MAKKPADPVKLNLRFTEGLRARLEKQAAKNNHSLNAEIVRRLEQSFDQADRLDILRNAMDRQVDQLTRRYGEEIAAFREIQIEAIEAVKASKQELALAQYKLEQLELKVAQQSEGAAVIEVLLGGNKLKSGVLRAVALALANAPDDSIIKNRYLIESFCIQGMSGKAQAGKDKK